MALSDIINRIEAEAVAEADSLVENARARAAADLEAAHMRADELVVKSRTRAEAAAEREAATVAAGARLAARDTALAAKTALVDEALSRIEAALVALPPSEYVAFLGERIAAVAHGGEAVRLGAADAPHAPALRTAFEAARPGVSVEWGTDPAPFEHGALIVGDRVSVDLSIKVIVADRRDELSLVIAKALFEPEKGGE